MTDSVEINPDGLRQAAVEFGVVADITRRILTDLQSDCEGRGEPWGDDKAGREFADGEKGYKANRDSTFTSLTGLVTVFGDNAVNLRDSANNFEANENEVSGNG